MSQHILERGSGHLPLDLIFDQVGYTTIILLSFFYSGDRYRHLA
jgi:hypothetical protein